MNIFSVFNVIYIMKEVIDRNTVPVNKLLLAGTDPVNLWHLGVL